MKIACFSGLNYYRRTYVLDLSEKSRRKYMIIIQFLLSTHLNYKLYNIKYTKQGLIKGHTFGFGICF